MCVCGGGLICEKMARRYNLVSERTGFEYFRYVESSKRSQEGQGDGRRQRGFNPQQSQGGLVQSVVHTTFVDDIPDSMDPRRLHSLYSNFGVASDVFIPFKRRKMSRTRFGFVWYDCSVAVTMAIQKIDGMWCDDKALKVKMAQFGKEEVVKHKSAQPNVGRDDRGNSIAIPGSHRGRSTSKPTITVKAFEEGNGWLYESVIVRLKSSCSVDDFKKELLIKDLGDIKFTIGGGKDVILSFNLVKMMQQELNKMEGWIKDWSDLVKVWKQGMSFDQERIVWLSYYGVPPNLWSFNTFNNIGRQWGKVIGLDDDTLKLKNLQCGKVRIATSCMESINASIILDCKGILYPVKIYEEQIVISKVVMQQCSYRSHQRKRANQSSNNEAADEAFDSDMDNLLVVQGRDEATKVGVGDQRVVVAVGEPTVSEDDGKINSERSVSVVEETISILEVACGAHNVNPKVNLVGSMQGVSGGHTNVNDVLCTPGFIRSMSGSVCNGAGSKSPTNVENNFQPICGVSAQHQLQIETVSGVGLGKSGKCFGPSTQVLCCCFGLKFGADVEGNAYTMTDPPGADVSQV
ncbi:hypothetical protein LOK49_LG07G01623 [Camellia lanceoleosa]|uniref:Uncharacterized protein n=1 Tax=Camellia lanceoleosa TaxID=1840588 RepID=A0ACC0H544_9ERIC|nr:hypothetical protein LOK49_LG07G01623 [Camellia lanceoleosa]